MTRTLITGITALLLHATTAAAQNLPPIPAPPVSEYVPQSPNPGWTPFDSRADCGWGNPPLPSCGQPVPMSRPAATTPVVFSGIYAPGSLSPFAKYPVYHYSHCNHKLHDLRHRAKLHMSPGNMFPVQPNYPVAHGYYYFKPYNYKMIPYQQAQAMRWSDRPDMPYSTPLAQDLLLKAARFQSNLGGLSGLSDVPSATYSAPRTPTPASQFETIPSENDF